MRAVVGSMIVLALLLIGTQAEAQVFRPRSKTGQAPKVARKIAPVSTPLVAPSGPAIATTKSPVATKAPIAKTPARPTTKKRPAKKSGDDEDVVVVDDDDDDE